MNNDDTSHVHVKRLQKTRPEYESEPPAPIDKPTAQAVSFAIPEVPTGWFLFTVSHVHQEDERRELKPAYWRVVFCKLPRRGKTAEGRGASKIEAWNNALLNIDHWYKMNPRATRD